MNTLHLATLTFFLILVRTHALSVVQGSPCFDTCNGNAATSQNDIVCTDDAFTNTVTGNTLSSCLTCLHGSTFRNGFMTDSNLFLYYLSSIQQSCLGNSDATTSCSSTCSGLSASFSNLGGRNQFQSPFSYCSANDNAYSTSASSCATCLQSNQGSVVLGNVVHVGDLGCQTTPSVQDGETIGYSGDLFATTALGSTSSSTTRASTLRTTTKPTSISASSTTGISSTASSVLPGSITVVLTATLALTPSPTASSASSSSEKKNTSASLSRGAAAGIGIALGLIGIAAIIAFAIILRRRLMRKSANFKRMSSPAMVQRSATPPAAGVFLPPGHRTSSAAAAAAAVGAFAKTGIGKSIAKEPAAKDIEADEIVPKHSKSFKSRTSKSFRSMTSKSWKSRNMTPRTSAWFYAANPKKSSDLTALPQASIVPGVGGVPEVPPSRGTLGRGWE